MTISVEELKIQELDKNQLEDFGLTIAGCKNLKILRCAGGIDNSTIETYRGVDKVSLAFADQEYDLALCSNFLFTYSHELSEVFHINLLMELARVARQIRVYPLTDNSGELSFHFSSVNKALIASGLSTKLNKLPGKSQGYLFIQNS